MIKCKFSAVICYLQHIVNACVNHSISHFLGSFRKFGYHLLLNFRWLYRDIVEVGFWHGKVKHICGFNIRHFLKHSHKFG